jgi:hypothetical protein
MDPSCFSGSSTGDETVNLCAPHRRFERCHLGWFAFFVCIVSSLATALAAEPAFMDKGEG